MDGETVGEGRITKFVKLTNETETDIEDPTAKSSKSGNYSEMENSKNIDSTNLTNEDHRNRNSTIEDHKNDDLTNSTKAIDDGKSDNSTHVVHKTDNSTNSTENDRKENASSHKQNNSSSSQANQPSISIIIQKENNESFRIDNQTKSTAEKIFYITKTTETKLKISNVNATAINTTFKDNASSLANNTSDNVTVLTSTEKSNTNKTTSKPGKNMDYLMLPDHNENSVTQREKQQGQGNSISSALSVNSSKGITEKAAVNRTEQEKEIRKVNGTHKEKSNQENSSEGNLNRGISSQANSSQSISKKGPEISNNQGQGISNQKNTNQGISNPASRHQVEKTSYQGVLGLQDDGGTGAEMFPLLSNRSFGDVDVQNEWMNVEDGGKSGTRFFISNAFFRPRLKCCLGKFRFPKNWPYFT